MHSGQRALQGFNGKVAQILEAIVEVKMHPIPKPLEAFSENIERIIYFSDGEADLAGEEFFWSQPQ